ncbi:MAG TPA: hypothetical protein VF623_00910 [Segetibacter sp.]
MIDEQQNNGNQESKELSTQTTGENTPDVDTKEDTSALYLGDTRLQSEEEFKLDKNTDHSGEDDSIGIARVDDLQANSDGAAGTDRAGTAERKNYGGTKLNQGLEDQGIEEYK